MMISIKLQSKPTTSSNTLTQQSSIQSTLSSSSSSLKEKMSKTIDSSLVPDSELKA